MHEADIVAWVAISATVAVVGEAVVATRAVSVAVAKTEMPAAEAPEQETWVAAMAHGAVAVGMGARGAVVAPAGRAGKAGTPARAVGGVRRSGAPHPRQGGRDTKPTE